MPLDPAPDDRSDDAPLNATIDHEVHVAWLGEAPRLKSWRADATDVQGSGDFAAHCRPASDSFAIIGAASRSAIVMGEGLKRGAVQQDIIAYTPSDSSGVPQ